jgi:hypothetical protein
MLWQFIGEHNGYDLCRTFSFVIPQLLNCFVSIGFIAIGLKISKTIHHELALKQEEALEQLKLSVDMGIKFQIDNSKFEEHIKKMLWNMWLIIISLSIVNLYGYLYSQAIYFTPSTNSCHFNNVSEFIYNFNTIIERFVTYVLWTAPIIYVFWPTYRNWYGGLKIKRRASSANSTASRDYKPLNHTTSLGGYSNSRTSVNKDADDSESSSEDEDYSDRRRVSSVAQNMPMVYAGPSAMDVSSSQF